MNAFLPNGGIQQLKLAVFRMKDCCALVQEGMNGYYETAALEKIPQIEFIFAWLRKRSISICLISDFNRSDTEQILTRLGWLPASSMSPIDAVLLRRDLTPEQLFHRAAQLFDLTDCKSTLALVDQVDLMEGAWNSRCLFSIGLNYGRTSARELANAPNHHLLDSIIELPNFLVQHLDLPKPIVPSFSLLPRGVRFFF